MRSDINNRLDTICRQTTAPSVLNALHACRDGHPLNRDNKYCWRNAHSIALRDRGISSRDTDWLASMAKIEWEKFDA